MLKRLLVLLALAVMLAGGMPAFADDNKEDKIKEELKKLQGKWNIVTLDGKKLPEGWPALFDFEVKENRLIHEKNPVQTEFVLDPTISPKTITMVEEVARSKLEKGKVTKWKEKQTTRAIYALDGDTLTICMPKDNKAERPARIESTKGTIVAVFKRKKP